MAGAFPWWVGQDEGGAGGFGTAPWWLRVPLAVAGVVLLVGVVEGRRRCVTAAAGVATAVAAGGALRFVLWSRADEIADARAADRAAASSGAWWMGPVDRELHALLTAWPTAASLAVALAAAGVAVIALVSASGAWPVPDGRQPAASAPQLRAVRPNGGTYGAVAGIVVGVLLAEASVLGAQQIRATRTDALGPWWSAYTASRPVPADKLHRGARRLTEADRANSANKSGDGDARGAAEPGLPTRPEHVAWRRTFHSPTALSTCAHDGHARATLVALERTRARATITGHDTRDGSRRWAFTVRLGKRTELGQVAVSAGCSVFVLIGSVLIGIDTYTGRAHGGTVLPKPGRDGWRFVTSYRQADRPPALVTLPAADLLHVAAAEAGVVAVRRADVHPLAWGVGRAHCSYLVDYVGPGSPGTLFVTGCGAGDVLVPLPDVSRLDRPERAVDYRSPVLPPLFADADMTVSGPAGCRDGDVERIRSYGNHVFLSGSWACGRTGRRTTANRRLDLTRPDPDADRFAPWRRRAPGEVPVLPIAEAKYDDVAVVGDGVGLGSGEAEDHWRGRVTVRAGERIVALAGPRDRAGDGDALLALGASGRLTSVTYHVDAEMTDDGPSLTTRLEAGPTSEIAREECDGTRSLLADTTTATALVLCRDGEDSTRVVAVVDERRGGRRK
ncbi:hypothetical protein ACIBL6_11625 [Streptomyces sp. NPDC050400]|uniref:hypothetical protein n=1 Tax=Streptomyces sp. NPDC050400 TaxID=3365610 RepID=UPI0037BE1960